MDKMISISEVSKLTGVTSKTLKIWDNEGKLKCSYKTIGGHRRYRLSDVEKFIGLNTSNNQGFKKNVFIYSRVSTKKQKESGNLERQKERLINYCRENQYRIVDIFEETASGLNDNRRELTKMLKRLDEVDSVVIEYPDRLARFGYNYLKEFAKSIEVEIEAIEQKERMVPNEEMVHDLISIVTCFSARLYGKSGGRKLKDTIKDLEKKRGEASEDNYMNNGASQVASGK